MKKKIGLIAGTFDPPTLGHIDLIKRASKICHILHVGIAVNSQKKQPFFSTSERKAMLAELCHDIPEAEINIIPPCLVVEYAKYLKVDFLIRGLRSMEDCAFEMQMAFANKKLSGFDTVFLLAHPEYAHISSTLLHEIALGGYRLHEFVPAAIEDAVYTRITMKDF